MSTKAYSHRTLVECSVGTTHTIDILVHLRRADVDWWNSDLPYHQAQLFKLVGRCILPKDKECSEEIEGHYLNRKRKRSRSGVVIGEKNVPTGSSAGGGGSAANRGGNNRKGRKGGGSGRAASKKGKQGNGKGSTGTRGEKKSDKDTTSLTALSKKEKGKTKHSAGVTYLFGDTIQLTYRIEDVNMSESATLLYQDQNDVDKEGCDATSPTSTDSPSGSALSGKTSKSKSRAEKKTKAGESVVPAQFRQLKKLPKRIVAWCYQFDEGNPTAPNPDGGGFPRPELVPISALFKDGS